MGQPLFLIPELHNKIWGGTALGTFFDFKLASDHVGEAWVISAHPNGVDKIGNGQYNNQTLADVWHHHKELFGGSKAEKFPLLVKFLDAKEDLSIQVHPDDDYAKVHAHELGKTECWYILDAKPNAKIYFGHNAQTKTELATMIKNKAWDKLFREVPVKAGEFYYIPAGTVHALGAGVLALEVQQSSDTTYRIYDFDRVDQTTGKLRELHLADAINVINVPSKEQAVLPITEKIAANTKTLLADEKYFNVIKWDIEQQAQKFTQNPDTYTLAVIISGNGMLTIDNQRYELVKGQALILPSNVHEWTIDGGLTVVFSQPK
ncbi:mannose-6-phosphate isomerase, class I [Periweissella fabalis]|uniref:Mannose-6-phosphate isomerase n=1 Tax=Periweissella fabalis TaxID=1070421 RepID=A0A7X6N3U8_9LACO|nr:mannose-6-phosphate isomerase, class I [Periweissella fabalis]MCM0598216.1 mannose-6-phosphate isomerase, class I [Periweissella fabalis]NKZ24849.1 mannose-6-phosphate isomerase, class I [Periweissella fabalis]